MFDKPKRALSGARPFFAFSLALLMLFSYFVPSAQASFWGGANTGWVLTELKTAGAGTYTVPANVSRLTITLVAAGASGGSSPNGASNGGGGGGAGEVLWRYSMTTAPAASIAYTVGAGGFAFSPSVTNSNGGTAPLANSGAVGGAGGANSGAGGSAGGNGTTSGASGAGGSGLIMVEYQL